MCHVRAYAPGGLSGGHANVTAVWDLSGKAAGLSLWLAQVAVDTLYQACPFSVQAHQLPEPLMSFTTCRCL